MIRRIVAVAGMQKIRDTRVGLHGGDKASFVLDRARPDIDHAQNRRIGAVLRDTARTDALDVDVISARMPSRSLPAAFEDT